MIYRQGLQIVLAVTLSVLANSGLLAPVYATSVVLTVEGRYTFVDAERTGGNIWTINLVQREGRLQGQVIGITDRRGIAKAPLCTRCSGAQRNRPVQGMVVIRDVEPIAGQANWRGTWFDATSGQSTALLLAVGAADGSLALRLCRGVFCKKFVLQRSR